MTKNYKTGKEETPQSRASRLERQRRYRERHRDKSRAYGAEHYASNRVEILKKHRERRSTAEAKAKARQYYLQNRERFQEYAQQRKDHINRLRRERRKAWTPEQKAQHLERKRLYRETHREVVQSYQRKWNQQNRERLLPSRREWKKQNAERLRQQSRARFLVKKHEIYRNRRERLGNADAKAAMAEYKRKWYLKNRERVKAESAARNRDNPARQEYARKWREEHPCYSTRWYHKNKDRAREILARSQAKYRDIILDYHRRYHGRKRHQLFIELLNRDGPLCYLCSQELGDHFKAVEVDHYIPRKLNGGNDIDNLRLTHKICNRRKSGKHPAEVSRARS